MIDQSQIGKRAWSYAGVLQQAGLSCVEYVEQLTMLLYLKMADQLTEEPDEGKLSSPVLRGGGGSNAASLPGSLDGTRDLRKTVGDDQNRLSASLGHR